MCCFRISFCCVSLFVILVASVYNLERELTADKHRHSPFFLDLNGHKLAVRLNTTAKADDVV